MDMREDILKTMHSLMYEIEDKLAHCETQIQDSREESRVEIRRVQSLIESADEEVRENTGSIANSKLWQAETALQVEGIK